MCGGPINSPQLLKLSGIGPAAELAAHGIAVVHDCRASGRICRTTWNSISRWRAREPITLFSAHDAAAQGADRRPLAARQERPRRRPTTSRPAASSAAAPACAYPDIQYHFLPMAMSYDGTSLAREHGFQAHVGPMRSKSSGWVRLASRQIRARSRSIFFNYLSHPDDWVEMRACVRLTREIFAQPAFARYRGREIQPGAAVQTDEQIDAFIAPNVETAYHPSCTCKMGRDDDPMAVVDPQTRVIGIEALRVVDSSIMPSITNGNLNAPTIMIAEKAADHILGRPLLPESSAPHYIAPNWETSQR